ncbi:MAG: DNA-processing protein DprA [Thermoleophilia bacterium]
MKAEACAPGQVRRREGRALCLWLARLATHRPGLIRELVLAESTQAVNDDDVSVPGSLTALLARRPAEIAARIARRRRQHQDQQSEIAARRPECTRFAFLLAAGPVEVPANDDDWVLNEEEADDVGDQIHVVTWFDALYPVKLRQILDPPAALFVRGCCAPASLQALSDEPVVAVVGSRAPSTYGLEMSASIARGVARAGLTVLSGLAMGVDVTAQDEAVSILAGARVPATVGVLGCGVDVVYPRSNATAYRRVLRHGLLISEFEPGAQARSWRFPARNRVMAGLADVVVVVEGTVRSGSLITAAHALDFGRDVLAVPGEAGRRLSAGPHKLLRVGAGLCESAADVLDAVQPGRAAALGDEERHVCLAGAQTPQGRLLRVLADAGRTADSLAALCNLTTVDTATALSSLEIDGLVNRGLGGVYHLVRQD